MRIGELARLSDLPTSTIRYYERRGLLPPAERNASGYRIYQRQALDRLHMIKFAQSLGFSLNELPSIFCGTNNVDHDQVMRQLHQKLAEVEQLLAQLVTKRNNISHVIAKLSNSWSKGECLNAPELENILAKVEL